MIYSRILLTTFLGASVLALGCGGPSASDTSGQSVVLSSVSDSAIPGNVDNERSSPSALGLTFAVPEDVQGMLKRKCYICHGGADTKGGFNFKRMVYQPDPDADWQPMDLTAATRIKLAILPLDGKPPKMPKRAGSILNSLTEEEVNRIAKWTDYPFEQ